MLQEATKIINSAFQESFIKRLSLYLYDCVREEVRSSTFRNLNQDKDNKWIFTEGEEKLFSGKQTPLVLDGSDSKITELMVQADISQKDRYLLYGYLFLTGKSKGKKKTGEFLTPLLYTPCRLEREGMNINCILTEETLSLNTGALAGLMKYEDEDEAENLFEGLIDVVPELPVTEEKLHIFLVTLKSLVPEIDIDSCKIQLQNSNFSNNEDSEENTGEEQEDSDFSKISFDKVYVSPTSAIILTKRPSITAGVLHELRQISEKPSGVFRETALNIINQEYTGSCTKHHSENKKEHPSAFVPVTPLELSDSQENVIKAITGNPLVAVYGTPGTGKSQTIVNLVSHLVATGKTVLVASRMDKAVDVVSDRLNGLGAPYLSLRAGRLNYQKQLNFQLQDLLSNKVDLETGFENAVLVDIDDMKTLVKTIAELEEKCEKIIKLEHNWYNTLQENIEQSKKIGSSLLISHKMSDAEIAHSRKILEKIENNLEKSGFLNLIFSKINKFSLKKALKIKNLDISQESIDQLKEEFKGKELSNRLKSTEASITKIGNLHQLIENIRLLRKKQKSLAVEILKKQRRNSLKGIISDQLKRQRLIVHSKALVERKKNLQSRLLEDEDFTPLLEAFPCWAVTTYAISESLPLKPGLFDVAIIDEASQCDIASCFPVLFRAKKAVIVGDDKQLPHLSFLEKAKEQSFLSQHNIPDKYQLMWRFRTNSMFDLANYYSSMPVLLDEHFRSVVPTIDFSNQEFYGGRIRIMSREEDTKGCIELNIVKDAKVDPDATRNMAETEKILEKLQEIIIEDKKNKHGKPVSIGIISPFREQVELIKRAISQVLSENTVRKHDIQVGTAHTFQGDERDIMILSFTLAPNSYVQSLTFLQKPNLFNVAITRAKKKLICFISKPVESLPNGLLRSYLEYIAAVNTQNIQESHSQIDTDIYNNAFEEEVAELCRAEGFTVKSGAQSAGFILDLVVSNENNSIIVECDGMQNNNPKPVKNIWKQSILERCGWKVMRLTAREWHYSKKVCIDRIKQTLGE